ncbi:MAG TPA: hypothetical protein VJM31_04330 [Vicinamibacterales bacterium]|nr:hypothetical protein [Vicinamibacterales bacterium]
MTAINRRRTGTREYAPYGINDTREFLRRYEIRLLSDDPRHARRMDLCRVDNDILCQWQREGIAPSLGEEGFDCFQKTHFGYCPKRQMKRRPPDPETSRLDAQAGSERRKVKELRERYLAPLNSYFGDNFSTEKGLIHTVRKRGYAIAAAVTYEED